MKKLLLAVVFSSIAWGQVTVVQSPVPKFRSFTPSGLPNVGGCVYTYASGTSTPQATYTDSTGLFANSNPVILDANGEAPIWITGVTYRFQVWTFGSGVVGSNCGNGTQLYQIDGVRDTGLNALNGPITIAPTSNGIDIFDLIRATDVSPSGNFVNFKSFAGATLFKVDIAGNITTIGTITGTWSGSITPTTATLSQGVLTGVEVAAPSGVASSDILWADSTAHRWKMNNNNGGAVQVVASGNDISTTDGVVALHFGATQLSLSNTAPTSGQCIQFNGSQVVGVPCTGVTESTWSASAAGAPSSFTLNAQIGGTLFPSAHTLLRYTIFLPSTETGCSTAPIMAFRDATGSTNLASLTIANSVNFIDSGALSVAMTATDQFVFQITTAGVGCAGGGSGFMATVVYK